MHEQMSMSDARLLTIAEQYKLHPEFLGVEILSVNQKGAFDSTMLHIAARTGDLANVQGLVDLGADLNVKGDLGNTPLHEAALCGQAAAADLLLALGACSSLKNEFGQVALDIARVGEKFDVCKVIEAAANKAGKKKKG